MSEPGPYAAAGGALVARGYSAIPISPTDKFPGRYSGGQWWPLKDWSRYCGELPTSFLVASWSRWPEANVGVACGRGVLAFDIDHDDLIEPIRAVLPPCVVAKRGRKGETLFYRGDTKAIASRGFKAKIDGQRFGLLDLIADGKQTVVPPSIHPDTAAPYVWTTERTLLDTAPAELTEITEEHLAAVIEVLRGFGYEAEPEIAPRGGIEVGDDAEASAEFFRALNNDALANLDAWVPRLGLARLTRSGDGYRSVAEWRPSNTGKPLGRRPLLLSIDPKGIVDYGDGDKGYTAINLVMAAQGERDLNRATVWLGEALGYDFAPKIVLNRKRAERSPIEEAARRYRMAQDADAAAEAPVAPARAPEPAPASPEAIEAAIDAAPNVERMPEHDESEPEPAQSREERLRALVEGVPGLIGDLVDWMCVTARTPNPILAFAASVAFVGALAGRNYQAPTDARTNFYTIGLAPSGFGKDHARQCIKHILDKGNLTRWLGGSKIMSGSAMRKRVEGQPATIYMIDEFGGFMAEINNKKMPHSYQIRDHLLEYFGSASTYFQGADYAGEQATKCHNPNVCVYGTSTPIDFWSSCRSLSVADGLLARCLVFPVGGELPAQIRPRAKASEPPTGLVKACQAVTLSKVGGNLNGVLSDGTTSSLALTAPWANAEAEDYFFAIEEEFRRRGFDQGEEEGGLWNRTAEHAVKLALLIAVGVDARQPILRKEVLALAREIVELCTLMTLDQVSGRLADNDRQREHVDVKRWIVEAGAAGLTRTAISKRVNGRFDRRRLDDILKSLEEDSKEVACVMIRPAGGAGRPGAKYFSAESLKIKSA